jgi:hypothetical protein
MAIDIFSFMLGVLAGATYIGLAVFFIIIRR